MLAGKTHISIHGSVENTIHTIHVSSMHTYTLPINITRTEWYMCVLLRMVANCRMHYTGCPPKKQNAQFFLLWYAKILHFLFNKLKHCLLKRMIPKSLILVEFGFYGNFSKHSHFQFSLHSCDISVRDNGFSDFHTLLPGSPLTGANKTERTYGLPYPP